VRPGRENVERLKTALRAVWNDPEIDEIRAEDFELYTTLRYGSPAGDFVLDILTQLSTAFRYEDLEAERLLVEGVSIRIATPATLVRMKQRTVRTIDQADAAALTKLFGLEKRH